MDHGLHQMTPPSLLPIFDMVLATFSSDIILRNFGPSFYTIFITARCHPSTHLIGRSFSDLVWKMISRLNCKDVRRRTSHTAASEIGDEIVVIDLFSFTRAIIADMTNADNESPPLRFTISVPRGFCLPPLSVPQDHYHIVTSSYP